MYLQQSKLNTKNQIERRSQCHFEIAIIKEFFHLLT